jgi:hypothetical protein
VTDPSRPDEAEPTVLVASGRADDDPASLWTALLAVAHGDGEADVAAHGPVAWAEHGIEASVERLQSVLGAGYDRILVVPVGVLDVPCDTDDRAARSAWQGPLAEAVDRLRMAYPGAHIHDLGRSAGGPEAATLARLVAVPRNGTPSMLAGAIARGFGGDPAGLARFIERLRSGLPAETTIALRGSAVVGHRHTEGTPFDGDGPGTSDLDIVAVGEDAVGLWVPEARLLGGINTLPLSDKATWVAPGLDRARRQAQMVVRRPLSIQAMAGWFLDLRAVVQRQPYVILHAPS